MSTETITLEKYVNGGECLGRLPAPEPGKLGRAIFVPHALPGETVRVRLTEDKPRYARGEIVELISPAPERIQPRCPHTPTATAPFTNQPRAGAACGGCHYQHIAYEKQLEIKAEILRDQLERIGKLAHIPMQPTVASQAWHYRNQVQFHLTPAGKLGYQASGTDTTVAIEECHLPTAAINQIWPRLEMEAIPGLARVILRSGIDDDLLILESSDPQPIELELDLALSVMHRGPGGELVLAGDDHILSQVHDRVLHVSAGSFFQTNTSMAEKMVTHLLENLPLHPQSTLIEAYCGVGLFSAFLAPQVGSLVGIENSPSACEDFAINLDEFDNVALYEAPVETVLPALDLHPDIIVVDPPRSGLARPALDAILSLRPAMLAYISCDPATLGRDAKRLTRGGYQLAQITPFDLFPQTAHIESISFWGMT